MLPLLVKAPWPLVMNLVAKGPHPIPTIDTRPEFLGIRLGGWPLLEYGMVGMGIMGDLTDVAAVILTIKLIRRGVGPSFSSLIVDGRPSNEALKVEVDAFSILLYQLLRVLKDDPHSEELKDKTQNSKRTGLP